MPQEPYGSVLAMLQTCNISCNYNANKIGPQNKVNDTDDKEHHSLSEFLRVCVALHRFNNSIWLKNFRVG